MNANKGLTGSACAHLYNGHGSTEREEEDRMAQLPRVCRLVGSPLLFERVRRNREEDTVGRGGEGGKGERAPLQSSGKKKPRKGNLLCQTNTTE